MLDEILRDAVENVKKITDPYNRVMAAAAILPYLESITAAPATKTKTRKTKTATVGVVKNDFDEAIDALDAEVTGITDNSSVAAINEGIKQGEEKAQAEAKAVEEAKTIIAPADIVIPTPKEDETPAETQHRISLFVKKYGDKKLAEIFADNSLMSSIEPEFAKVAAFQGKLHAVLDKHADEETVESLFHHYISEAAPGVKEYTDVTMDKFLLVYMPYQDKLDKIYSVDLTVMDKAIRELYGNMIAKDNTSIQIGMINIDNAQSLIDVINAIAA